MTLPRLPERVAQLHSQGPWSAVEAMLTPAVGVVHALQQRMRSRRENDDFVDVEAARVSDSDITIPGAVGFANLQGVDEIYRIAPSMNPQAFYCISNMQKRIFGLWSQIAKARRSRNRRREKILGRKLEREIPKYQKLVNGQQKINSFGNPSKWVLKRLSQYGEMKMGKDAAYLTGEPQDYVNIHNKDALHVAARSLLECKLTQWLSVRMNSLQDWYRRLNCDKWWSREKVIESNDARCTEWSEKSIVALKTALVLSATLVLICMPVVVYSLGIVSSLGAVASLYGAVVVIGCLLSQAMFDFITSTVVTLGLAALVGNSISGIGPGSR
ncbi:hypothetical protein PT974_06862 [Cladobotryum mycophilum]|uniref:DUF6594 domain-containing protein n=1 Tax=Cladobotryum mycophilum TaxID=491253 RepID=A0ABR0SMP3_9HYPO